MARIYTHKNNFKVEIQRRLDLGWEENWVDITHLFIEKIDAIQTEIDIDRLEGNVTQASALLEVDNLFGHFQMGSNAYLFNGAHIYHSRLRYWEHRDNTLPNRPIIDGLISAQPRANKRTTVAIQVSSKLDILRNHYILENLNTRVRHASSHAIMEYVIYLFKYVYPELGVITTGGLLRADIFYEDIAPYNDDLLKMLYKVVEDGGGIGGIRRDNKLFFTYHGASKTERQDFVNEPGITEGLYRVGNTGNLNLSVGNLPDQSGNNKHMSILTEIKDKEGQHFRPGGAFGKETTNFWSNRLYSEQWCLGNQLSDYTMDISFKIDANRGAHLNAHNLWALGNVIGFADLEGAVYETFNSLFCFSTYSRAASEPYPTFQQLKHAAFMKTDGSPEGDQIEWSVEHFEGLFKGINNKLYYMHVTTTPTIIGSGANPDGWYLKVTVNEKIELCSLCSESLQQLITFTVDCAKKEGLLYFNGKLKTKFISEWLTDVSYNKASSQRVKLVGHGCDITVVLASGVWFYPIKFLSNTNRVFYSSMRISNVCKGLPDTGETPFETYTKYYGSEFDLQNPKIIEISENKGNLFSLQNLRYRNISNMCMLEDQVFNSGLYEFRLVSGNRMSVRYPDSSVVRFDFSDISAGVNAFNQHDTNLVHELQCKLFDDPRGENNIRIVYTGTSESYLQFSFIIFSSSIDNTDPAIETEEPFVFETGAAGSVVFSLMPFDNSLYIGKDLESIKANGLQLYKLKNYEMIENPFEVRDALKAALDARVALLQRCDIRVPFDYAELDIMDVVDLRVQKEYIYKVYTEQPTLLELFNDWEDLGNYWRKIFDVISTTHTATGDYTSLKLQERQEV